MEDAFPGWRRAERAYEGAARRLQLGAHAQTPLASVGPGATPHLTHSVYRARAVIGKKTAMRGHQHAPASGRVAAARCSTLCAAPLSCRLGSAAHAGAQPTARALNKCKAGRGVVLRLSRTVAGKWRAVKMLFAAVRGCRHARRLRLLQEVQSCTPAAHTRRRRMTCYNTTGSVTSSPP